MEEVKQIFVQEAEELLEQMEDALLSMEDAPDDDDYLNCAFRAVHTIKGSAGIFGYQFIVDFTHPVETELDRVRKRERTLESSLVAWLLQCKDHIANQIQFIAQQGDTEPLPKELAERSDSLLDASQINLQPVMQKTEAQQLPAQVEPELPLELHRQNNWLISLDFKADTFRHGLDPMSFIHYLHGLGEIAQVMTILRESKPDESIDPESCQLSFRIEFISTANKQTIAEVFSFAEDDCDIRILPPQSKQQHYIELLHQVPQTQLQQLGEMLLQVGAVTQSELDKALQAQQHQAELPHRPIGEILVNQQVVHRAVVDEAITKQDATRSHMARASRSIRVDPLKLGQLINLVGELVIASASMRTQISKHGLTEVDEAVTNMERLVEGIRDNALQLRMVPIGDSFSRFRRVVRDVSSEQGKEIELMISGGESELDKSVVEKLNDPLTHLVRNALDHGIETPQERIIKGKSARGTVKLNAFHESGHIVVEISDDGAGLNLESIRRKAEAIGLVRSDQPMTRQEILRLIFEPGLSTKQEATRLSGRGVGMDVVKRNIEALRGSVDLDSEIDQGTKITIRLPLTLAIIDGFLVGVGRESYIIPLSLVEECVEFNRGTWQLDSQNNFVSLRGEALPFIRLRDFFALPGSAGTSVRESLVVVRFGRKRAALVVEELLGEQQTVIKPLGAVFDHLQGISGATVLGSGDVALILDIRGLVDLAIEYARSDLHEPVLGSA